MREASGFVLQRTAPFRFYKQLRQFVSAGSYRNLKPGTAALMLNHEYLDYKIFRAIDGYRPSDRFKGRITIIRTEASPPSSRDLNKQWFEFTTEDGDVHVLPGHHGNWLEEHIDNFVDVLEVAVK